jgi:hypothetical protein
VNTIEAEGFFPEREVLRARRLRAMVDQPADPSEARTRRTDIWVVWFASFFAVFLPMFVSTITLGWNGHITPSAVEVLMYTLSFVAGGCGALVAVVLWRRLSRSSS